MIMELPAMLSLLNYMVAGVSAVALVLMAVLVVQIYRSNDGKGSQG